MHRRQTQTGLLRVGALVLPAAKSAKSAKFWLDAGNLSQRIAKTPLCEIFKICEMPAGCRIRGIARFPGPLENTVKKYPRAGDAGLGQWKHPKTQAARYIARPSQWNGQTYIPLLGQL
jgi:hypothetical protein